METWSEVDRYFTQCLGLEDEALAAAQQKSAAGGLPAISRAAARSSSRWRWSWPTPAKPP